MIPNVTLTLPPQVRRRAERFFQADLGGVRLHIGAQARALGAWAFAWGPHVFLDRRALGLPWPLVLELLGHELTHVVQQSRQAAGSAAAAAADVCEAEADELGRCFADGFGPPAAGGRARSWPRPQRLVTVAGQTIRQVDDLAPRTQTMLALIDGAERWLSWAIPIGAPYFRFADDLALVTAVQQGLHGSPLMLLPRLRLLTHPRKLWTLKEEQLNQLLSYEGDDEDNEVLGTSVQSVLNEYGIFTQQNLASGLQFLQQLGQAQLPLFQALSLADQIGLMELVKTPPSALALDRTAQADAAAFAAEAAQSPREFVDYYGFYFAVAQRLAQGVDRASSVRAMRDALTDPAQALLPCPVAARVPTTVEMYALVNQWVDQHQLIGFATIAAALRQIAQSGPLPGSGEEAPAFSMRLRAFVDGIQQFLKYTEPSTRALSQDGLTHTYALESKAAVARLDRTDDGNVTVGAYRSTASPPPSPNDAPALNAPPVATDPPG